jgi:hypothetical protein
MVEGKEIMFLSYDSKELLFDSRNLIPIEEILYIWLYIFLAVPEMMICLLNFYPWPHHVAAFLLDG